MIRLATILDNLNQFIDNDVAMIYGETGAGKSKLATQVALDAAKAGKKVKFIDTERNLSKADIAQINKVGKYIYNPTWNGLENEIDRIGNFDLLILDSIGMPALKHYASMKMNAKGGAMLDMIGILGKIKDWCYNNGSVSIVTNQNQSAMAAAGKGSDYILRPFGEKAQYVCKEIWRMVLISSKPNQTFSTLSAYRSREMGRSTVIADVSITDKGTELRMKKQAQAGISQDAFDNLMNGIKQSQYLNELNEAAEKIKSLTNEMSGTQKQALKTAWAAKEKEIKAYLDTEDPKPNEDEHLKADAEIAKQESIIQ